MGLDVYLEVDTVQSAKFPEHFMNPTYLRSSYNPSGFNNFVPQLTGDEDATFYDIFSEAIEKTIEKPNPEWEEAKDTYWGEDALPALSNAMKKALEIDQKIRACPPYGAWDIFWFEDPTLSSEKAVSQFNKLTHDNKMFTDTEPTKENPYTGSPYSSQDGTFYPKGLTIYAALPSLKWGKPCVSLIYRLEEETVEHYAQAAYIAAEFAEKAIDTIRDKGEVQYVWSG